MHKNECGPFSYTKHKHNLKMDEVPKSETLIHQTPRGEFRQQLFFFFFFWQLLFDLSCSDCYQGTSQKAQETTGKHREIKLLGLIQGRICTTMQQATKQKAACRIGQDISITNSAPNKTINPVKKWGEYMNRLFSKED